MFIYTDRLPHHFHIEINCSIPSCNIEPNCKGKPPQDDVMKRKHIPHYWPAVRGIHQWPFIPAQRASDVEMSQRNYYHQQRGFTVCVKRQTINQCHADSDLVSRWLYAFYSEYLRNANIKKNWGKYLAMTMHPLGLSNFQQWCFRLTDNLITRIESGAYFGGKFSFLLLTLLPRDSSWLPFVSTHTYIYIYMCVCVCIYMYALPQGNVYKLTKKLCVYINVDIYM